MDMAKKRKKTARGVKNKKRKEGENLSSKIGDDKEGLSSKKKGGLIKPKKVISTGYIYL